jgi:23S rRNA (cytosine1962-C5)-methyltransferase
MYPSLILKSGRDRSIINRHPWIFSGAVKTLPTAENGDIVAIRDNHNTLLGYGFFSEKSQITCRMFEFTNQEMRFDTPDYWVDKIRRAYQIRKQYVISEQTNCYRLIHAEGDGLPGIIADVYGEVAVLQLLIKGTEKIAPFLLEGLSVAGVKHIWLKNKHNAAFFEDVALQNGWLSGAKDESDPVMVQENGLKFMIDFEKGQKTGFFVDQRDNRALVGLHSKGKKVLNAFSYTGGFSVYALAGGASMVHSVDISKDAVQICDQNVALNFEGANHASFAADCFDYLKSTTEEYDIMVLDPPAFAKNARSVPNASRGYKELNMAGIRKIKPGGLIFTFSCSQNIDRDLFRKIVFSAAADAGRSCRIIHQLTQPIDHPVNIYHPEGEYLKGLVLYIE